jgi:hypothetical protein
MFVTKSTYEKAVDEAKRWHEDAKTCAHKYEQLLAQWNSLIREINSKGGEEFLNSTPQFTDDELKQLIMLCHPDKHDGKRSAVEMTQKLNNLRSG